MGLSVLGRANHGHIRKLRFPGLLRVGRQESSHERFSVRRQKGAWGNRGNMETSQGWGDPICTSKSVWIDADIAAAPFGLVPKRTPEAR